MHKAQQTRYQSLYQRHLNALQCQGKSQESIEAYSRAVRRITEHFDRCPDRLSRSDLETYFSALIQSHSWSATRGDSGPATLTGSPASSVRLGGSMGMTAVLHTPSRRLDYHPHVHVVVAGGCLNKVRKQWKRLRGRYLFNEQNLARVFRALPSPDVRPAGPENYTGPAAHIPT